MMKASLQFEKYHVIESIYKYNPFFKGEDRLTPNLFFNLDISSENIYEATLILGIELGDHDCKESSLYLKAKILGLFTVQERDDLELTEKQIQSFYKTNAVAILFPYLRSLVSDLSSKGSEPPIILPTLNIVATLKEKHPKKSE